MALELFTQRVAAALQVSSMAPQCDTKITPQILKPKIVDQPVLLRDDHKICPLCRLSEWLPADSAA
jgi:hypothetical protein